MKWKLTGRYLLSVVLVVIVVVGINLLLLISGLIMRSAVQVPQLLSSSTAAEEFTRSFGDQIESKAGQVNITPEGKHQLEQQNAWVQILDEQGRQLYTYRTPADLPQAYTPAEIIQMYKYKELDMETTLFMGSRSEGTHKYSYFIGIRDRNLSRYVFFLDLGAFLSIAHIGTYIIVLDILIALLIGCFFSKRLTQPLYALMDKIKRLASSDYYVDDAPKGIYASVFSNLNDLSNRLQANEAERSKLDRMREEWIANVSHDIKTPLASIQGFAEMLRDADYQFTLEEIREYAGIIENKSVYIKEVIEDLNLTTRLRNKVLVLNKQEVNLVSLLRSILIDIMNDPQYAARDLELEAGEEPIMKHVDELLLRRAINNLVYNSILHNEPTVQIRVTAYQAERIHIIIQDNGKGISPEELDQIFNRYYRGTNSGEAHKGSGLGMAIAKDIIQEHNGSISIQSTPGQGTRIEIVL
ncbi:sensor histidine kinase [Paenibacillus shenyangensis]|uniref:sensor histidine kinase n=1 Tax=Paenibacillus sp. A9 TaxID=1284352 RepID=UPI000374AF9F|nr:HAMP domain-containing sensor histidine kinase [Paenibacillus sp. A9]